MKTSRTQVRRQPARGAYDPDTVFAVLDAARICHIGFAVDAQPYVIPTIHARIGDTLYLHGAPASRMLRTLAGGTPLCVTATLVDALVLAKSAFHHSMNYRSVVVLGQGLAVEDPAEKMRAFEALVERLVPGRWRDCRVPNDKEIASTSVLRIAITEASVKVRTGPPMDAAEDQDLPYWAGIIPLSHALLPPEPWPGPSAATK